MTAQDGPVKGLGSVTPRDDAWAADCQSGGDRQLHPGHQWFVRADAALPRSRPAGAATPNRDFAIPPELGSD